MNVAIRIGDMVTFSCEGHLPNGELMDPDQGKEPFRLIAGKFASNPMQKKLALALVGMRVSDFKTVRLQSRECFGPRNESLNVKVQVNSLPQDMKLNETITVEIDTKNGAKAEKQGVLKVIDGDEATIDFNHPFAGMDITFNITILAFEKPKK